MIKSLLLVYSIAILAISGNSHAEEVGIPGFGPGSLKIESVEFAKESYMVRVTGTKPNICYSTPTPVLIPTTNDNLNWSLKIVATPSNKLCATMEAPFTLVFDVRTLFYQRTIQSTPGQLVTIKIDDTGEVIEIDASAARSVFPYSNKILRGRLEKSVDGFVLTESGQAIANLKSPAVNMDTFVDQKVEVAGLNLVKVLPIVDLTGSGDKAQSPQDGLLQLLVTGISASGSKP